MQDYKPNSHKSKAEGEERERLEKVVSCDAKRKKKGVLSTLAGAIISDDANNVGNHAFLEILVPSIKQALADVVIDSVNIIFFGETGKRSGSRFDSGKYVAYDSRYSSRTYSSSSERPRTVSSGYEFDNIVLATRTDAEKVLMRMDEIIRRYGIVRVADLYDLVGLNCDYTDNKYGWTSLRTAEPRRVSDGYILKLPKAMPID